MAALPAFVLKLFAMDTLPVPALPNETGKNVPEVLIGFLVFVGVWTHGPVVPTQGVCTFSEAYEAAFELAALAVEAVFVASIVLHGP